MEKTNNIVLQTSDLQVVCCLTSVPRFSAQVCLCHPAEWTADRRSLCAVGLKSLAAAPSSGEETPLSLPLCSEDKQYEVSGWSSLLMPLEPLAVVARRSRGQCVCVCVYTCVCGAGRGISHPRMAATVGGAGGSSAWRGRRVLIAGLVLLLFMEAEADVALQGSRG